MAVRARKLAQLGEVTRQRNAASLQPISHDDALMSIALRRARCRPQTITSRSLISVEILQ